MNIETGATLTFAMLFFLPMILAVIVSFFLEPGNINGQWLLIMFIYGEILLLAFDKLKKIKEESE